MIIPLPLYTALIDPVYCQRLSSDHYNSAHYQAENIPNLHIERNGMKDQNMIQQFQYIQYPQYIKNPLFIQHEQRKNYNTNHGRNVIKTEPVYAKVKGFQQNQSGTEVFIKCVRAACGNVQKPYTNTAGHHQRNHPQFPRHNDCPYTQHHAEHCRDDSQQQMPAYPLLRPHHLSSSSATRFSSS